MNERVFSILDSKRDEAVALLQKLISFESIATPTDDPDAPQGKAVADCLRYALDYAKNLGLSVTNLDGVAGLIDSDDVLEPKIGMLCHLDVVPAGDGWVHAPFGGEVEDGILYGRGASDDKGPFVSALLALAAIRDAGVKLNYGIRLIAGTCEETGSEDIAYCKAHGVIPPHVFSPDANFPIVNTEKGIARFTVSAPFPEESTFASLLGGDVINMVPQHASATTKDARVIAAEGLSAHASLPELGQNAISLLFETLLTSFPHDAAARVLGEALALCPVGVTDGTGLGIRAQDEISGELTASLDLLKTEEGRISLSFDVRYPLCVNEEGLHNSLTARLCGTSFTLDEFTCMPPHHVPKESALVTCLLDSYREVSKNEAYCIAIGGGTYVHDIEGGVAFGTMYPGEDNRIHSPDEFVAVDHLIQNAKIFADALLRLQHESL